MSLPSAQKLGGGSLRTLLVICLALSGCEGGWGLEDARDAPDRAADSASYVESDSAGIPVITNTLARHAGGGLSLASEPELTIGVADGARPYLFHRPVAGVILDGPSVAISDNGNDEVRFFDSQGTHIRTVGGSGEGPGDLNRPLWIGVPDAHDTLVVTSQTRWGGALRVSYFGPDGTFVRAWNVETGVYPYLAPGYAGVLADGKVVVVRGEPIVPPNRPPEGAWRPPHRFSILDLDGDSLVTIGPFPGADFYARRLASGELPQASPFSRMFHLAARGDRIAAGHSEEYSIRIYDDSGVLLRVVRRQWDPIPSGPYADEWIQEEIERAQGTPVSLDPDLLRAAVPEFLPAFVSIQLAQDGSLWVEEYRPPSQQDQPSTWDVYDPEGIWVASVSIPAHLRVLDIGRGFLLARRSDDMGTARVELYRLEEGSE